MKLKIKHLPTIFLGLLLFGCQADSRQQILAADKSQVALRAAQSRVLDTTNRSLSMRTVIATLQDLGFTVDKVDRDIGVVSATKAADYLMKMTVSVRQRGNDQVVVRASAQHNLKAVSDAAPYQQFFNALEQAVFLENNASN